MADELDQPFTDAEPAKPGWFARLKARSTAMRQAIVEYLPVGIISTGVIMGSATLIGHSGMLGGAGEWLGSHLGAANDGWGRAARWIGIGVVTHGVMGMYKSTTAAEHHTDAGSQHTAAAKKPSGHAPALAMTHEYNDMEIENLNKTLPRLESGRGSQSQAIIS